MEKYFKRKSTEQSSTPNPQTGSSHEKKVFEFELEKLPNDPGSRPKMSDYHPSDRDEIRRYYLQKGHSKPKEIILPQRKFGDIFRMFNSDWYLKYGSWLEYSQSEDAAYYLCCYLMRSHLEEHKGCGDAFITEGLQIGRKVKGFKFILEM